MASYQYQHGDRPLEGYTIERAAGRGGFGEVYYAVSDSGRQVALKAVQSYEQIELRGISQCMNLKSPHLVTVFDVKYNKDGRPFVVMEFVSGVSLSGILNDSPSGLGQQKAAFFVREIAKGLSFLHDCGVVHRDLKPSNIFYEDGYVKIGDYGLSKAISASVHSGQTITVGTVHYMAPEIGSGCYDRSIDIYALGVILYEMLTGQVPYFGSSPAEILMKHVTAEPDLTGIGEPFATAIRKAMTKDPKQRYQTVQEMVEGIFGAEHVRNSVSQFSPESLSVVAAKAAEKVKSDRPAAVQPVRDIETVHQPNANAKNEKGVPTRETVSQQVGYIGGFWGRWRGRVREYERQVNDPIDWHQRRVLGLVALLVISIGTGLVAGGYLDDLDESLAYAVLTFFMILGALLGVNLCLWCWLSKLEKESKWLRHAITGGVASLCAFIFSSIGAMVFGMGYVARDIQGTWLAIGILFCLEDWWKLTAANRKERVSLFNAVGQAGFGALVCAFIPGDQEIVLLIGVLAGTSLVIQILSPYDPKAYPKWSEDDQKRGEDAGPARGVERDVRGGILRGAQANRHAHKDVGMAPTPNDNAGSGSSGSRGRASDHFNSFSHSVKSLHPVAFLLSSIGIILLLFALAVGLVVSLHVPALVMGGYPDPGLSQEMTEIFGSAGLAEKVGYILAVVLCLLAACCMILARRRFGIAHMARAVVGILGFILALSALSASLPSSYPAPILDHLHAERFGIALEQILSASNRGAAIYAAIFFLLSLIVLVWPPRKEKPDVLGLPEEEEENFATEDTEGSENK